LRALDGFYPNGLTAKILLKQMVVSDIPGAASDPGPRAIAFAVSARGVRRRLRRGGELRELERAA
ncbi:MAG: hypothetical protein WD834_08575, partial [Actinomycetota bacterium]